MNQKIKTILLWILLILSSWVFIETIKEILFSLIFLHDIYNYGILSILDNFLTENFLIDIFPLILLLAISMFIIKKSHKWICFINPLERQKISREDIKKTVIHYFRESIIFFIILILSTTFYCLILVDSYKDDFWDGFIAILFFAPILTGLFLFFIKWWNEARIKFK